MPRQTKGPRLWFRKERLDVKTGKRISAGTWIIIDGDKQQSTGFVFEQTGEAERALAEYNVARYRPPRKEQDIEHIPVTDVLAVYDDDKRDGQANQRKYDERMLRLTRWWAGKVLSDVNGETCRDYTKHRLAEQKKWKPKGAKITPGSARRELEDLRAAINHHAKEGLHRGVVRVWLPEKGLARDRWLTRSEAATLVWKCWRYRESQIRHKGPNKDKLLPTAKKPLQHVARFILIGLYTGTRAAAIASASPTKEDGRAWVDIDNGVFYRLAVGKKATNKRQPPVSLPDHLLAHLKRWCTIRPGDKDYDPKDPEKKRPYFVQHNGVPVLSVTKGFAHGVEMAGIKHATPHTLRHTAATWLMQAGVEIWEAASYLGMSAKLLETTYGHHHPAYLKGAKSAFRSPRLRPAKLEKTLETTSAEPAKVLKELVGPPGLEPGTSPL